jgi:hypothetical protein
LFVCRFFNWHHLHLFLDGNVAYTSSLMAITVRRLDQ